MMSRNANILVTIALSALTGCPTGVPDAGDKGEQNALLYVGLMIHLEGHDLSTRTAHDNYRDAIFAYADIFEQYGAKVTWEAKEPLVSCDRFNDYYLKTLEDRGHGIGVHADAGGNPNRTDYTYEDFVNELKFDKNLLEKQNVTVRHVSGICSHLDWTSGVIEAGYLFTTGVISYCTVSLPDELRPEAFINCVNPAECHEPFPDELKDRIHPWRAKTENWTEYDPDGSLVILPEGTYGLVALHELLNGDSALAGSYEFTHEDIDAYFSQLEEALSYVDPAKVNTFYVAWSFGSPLDEELLREWLSRIVPYVESGQVVWKTLPEMYDLYVREENGE